MCKYKMISAVIMIATIQLLMGRAVAGQLDEQPGPKGDQEVWTVAVLADLNGPYGSLQYNEHVHAAVDWIRDDLQPDLVLVAGDMVAGQREELKYGAMWKAFHDTVTDPLAQAGIPMAITPGNHDASEQPRFWEERIEFSRQWRTRRPQLSFVDDRFYPFYYAFELGPMLVVSLDGTGIGDLDAAQQAWIDTTLSENSHLEVSLLLSHVPQYAVAQGREREAFFDENLATMMRDYDVDLMVSGHHHAYFPARHDGTYLLHASALGSGVRVIIGESQPRPRNVTVLTVNESGIESIEAFESPAFEQRVDIGDLPRSIKDGGTELHRMDVEAEGEDEPEPES